MAFLSRAEGFIEQDTQLNKNTDYSASLPLGTDSESDYSSDSDSDSDSDSMLVFSKEQTIINEEGDPSKFNE